MNKKSAIVLIMALSLLPSTVFSFENPLKSYNLYDDVKGGGNNANGERETVMSEYYSNSLKKPSGETIDNNSTQASNDIKNMQMPDFYSEADLGKIMEVMGKIQKLDQSSSISTTTKINKTKEYLKELESVAKKYPNSPNYKERMQYFNETLTSLDKLNSSSFNDEEKLQELVKLISKTSMLNDKNLKAQATKTVSIPTNKGDLETMAASVQGRNSDLRRSSMQVYSNAESPAQWLEGPSFYENPSLDSIMAEYKKSNFAGAMQEAESYVRKHPTDTLGFYYLAMSYAKTGNKENAIKAYEKVISFRDNPMIVKYATNGRNCVMSGVEGATCYQNVNVPELKYPYKEIAKNMDMTPIDVDLLIESNVADVQKILNPIQAGTAAKDKDGKPVATSTSGVKLPFGNQDEKLDEFINSPYGNGFSPELNQEYKLQQLKQIKQNINNGQNEAGNIEDIKNFDNKKSDASDDDFEPIKLAYDNSFDFEQLKNDPEYIRNKKEMDELNMLFNGGRSSSKKDLYDLIPSLTDKENGISPQMFSQMMMNSIMPDIINTDVI